jgi:hypothetical protein
MAAGFQRHVDGRPAGEFARVTQRHHLGVSIPGALCTPLPDDNSISNHNRPNRRVRATDSHRKQGLFKCELQKVH